MNRFLLPLLFIAVTLPAQEPARTLTGHSKVVDDALHARVKQFYDYHVAKKYRQAEQLVAEESKEDFYVLSKLDLQYFKIGNVEYSEKMTKAKVIIIGAMPVLFPMAGGKIMDGPFASYWKLEHGQWCWYYNKEAARHTPFGDVKGPIDGKPRTPATALPTGPNVSIEALQSALKIDRTRVELSDGKPQSVKVTNTLPGPASLTVECPNKPIAQTGITATFDKKDLKGNETAVLTFTADPSTPPGVVPLFIIVSPTNQILNISVNVSPH